MSRSELLSLGRSSYGWNENCWQSSSVSGVIAAGAASGSILWFQRVPLAAGVGARNPLVIERLRVRYTCITSFTTPVTAGRGIGFCLIDARPSVAGAGRSNLLRKQNLLSLGAGSGNDGEVRIIGTTPFAPTGAAPSVADVFASLPLSGLGTSGNSVDREWEWNTGSAAMASVIPGAYLALITTAAMDAAGTFELCVESDIQGLPTDYPDPPV